MDRRDGGNKHNLKSKKDRNEGGEKMKNLARMAGKNGEQTCERRESHAREDERKRWVGRDKRRRVVPEDLEQKLQNQTPAK